MLDTAGFDMNHEMEERNEQEEPRTQHRVSYLDASLLDIWSVVTHPTVDRHNML